LNRRYTPFYKWQHRAVADLPLLGATVHAQIHALLAAADARRQAQLMEWTAQLAIQAIRDQGLSDLSSDFLLDHAPAVQRQIRDVRLRENLNIVQ
jgi:hypothetical protein